MRAATPGGRGPLRCLVVPGESREHFGYRPGWQSRAFRQAAGTLSGVAAGAAEDAARNVLADLAAVFGADTSLPCAEAADRLARRFPDRYDGLAGEALPADCRALGVRSVTVRQGSLTAKGAGSLTSRPRQASREPGTL
jgi:hypothetical protein